MVKQLVRPSNLAAERAVIRTLFSRPETLTLINLTPEMFFGVENAIVFKVLSELIMSGRSPDESLVSAKLLESGYFEMIGGDSYFEAIRSTDTLETNLDAYAKEVHDCYILRIIIESGNNIIEAGYNSKLEEALNTWHSEQERVINRISSGEEFPRFSSILGKEISELVKRYETKDSGGLPSGFVDYDILTGGLYPSDEIIIAARPSVGKTTVALRMMLNLAKNGIPVGMFSYEMSSNQLVQRMLSMESDVALTHIKTGVMTLEQYNKVLETSNYINSLPIFIYSGNESSVDRALRDGLKLVKRHDVKIIFIDYLQLMEFRTEFATLELGNIARKLKLFAKQTNTTVVCLSQLSRAVESREHHIPVLSDLRQSGGLEEHADIVLMLHRPTLYSGIPDNTMNFYIRKNRNGPLGVIKMSFEGNFVDVRQQSF